MLQAIFYSMCLTSAIKLSISFVNKGFLNNITRIHTFCLKKEIMEYNNIKNYRLFSKYYIKYLQYFQIFETIVIGETVDRSRWLSSAF